MDLLKTKTLLSTQTANKILDLVDEAKNHQLSYEDFLDIVIEFEWNRREENMYVKKIRNANLPYIKLLSDFDINRITGITKSQLEQLMELKWVDEFYNLLLLGRAGLGKSHIAIGLAILAIEKGKKVVFITAKELMTALKTEDTIKSSAKMMKKIRDIDMLIIDDLIQMAKDKGELRLFFDLIICLYEKTSIIITSNFQPKDWSEDVKNQKTLVAVLDKLGHRSETVQLEGTSYRMEHKKTIFKDVK